MDRAFPNIDDVRVMRRCVMVRWLLVGELTDLTRHKDWGYAYCENEADAEHLASIMHVSIGRRVEVWYLSPAVGIISLYDRALPSARNVGG